MKKTKFIGVNGDILSMRNGWRNRRRYSISKKSI